MNKTELVQNVTRTFGKIGLSLKKHSPEILLVTGIVGGVVSAVMACKATTKVSSILEKKKEQIDGIHEIVENPEGDLAKAYEKKYNEKFTEEQGKKELAIVYAQTGLEFVKLYAPSVLLGVASIGCLLASNNIIHKRNVALAAAYATVDNSFKGYRNRLIERFDKELDRELLYNLKSEEIEEVTVDENGNEIVEKKIVTVMGNTVNGDRGPSYSPYSIVFDDGNTGWDKDPELTKYFLIQTQNYWNDVLRTKGYVFLNEVYESLGAQRTKAGQVMGWYYDRSEKSFSDNYIDFGIFDIHRKVTRDFVNGYERCIILDFNVDGNIMEMLA